MPRRHARDTARADDDATDFDNGPIMFPPLNRVSFFVLAFVLFAPLAAQPTETAATDDEAVPYPLPRNLSLPRGASSPDVAPVRKAFGSGQTTPAKSDHGGDQATPAEPESDATRAADAPYGTGFEARRRAFERRGFGDGRERGHGHGRGRGR